MTLTAQEKARYSRHLLLPEIGERGQQQLRAARVLIVGAGGLGSPAALYLAAAGVGHIGIIDHDTVELSNLQRQVLFASDDVGQSKAELARARLLQLNPGIEVTAHAEELRAANAESVFAAYDVVLDGSDRLGTRYLVNDACVLLGKSLVSAAIHRFEGQAMTYVPKQGPCYRCLFSDPAQGGVPNCAEAGVLGVLPGVLGSIQATEAIKLVTGIGTPLIGRLLTYDALDMRFREFRFQRRADCAVCGERPGITTLRDAPAESDVDVPGLRPWSATELRDALRNDVRTGRLVLVDVREPAEFALDHLEGSLNIPLADLPGRIAELAGRQPVFLCLSGVRSREACAVASRHGITTPGHLIGGLRDWPVA